MLLGREGIVYWCDLSRGFKPSSGSQGSCDPTKLGSESPFPYSLSPGLVPPSLSSGVTSVQESTPASPASSMPCAPSLSPHFSTYVVMISSCAASPINSQALPGWSQVLTLSGFPASGTRQALCKYPGKKDCIS